VRKNLVLASEYPFAAATCDGTGTKGTMMSFVYYFFHMINILY
jgi:hypothetical protein